MYTGGRAVLRWFDERFQPRGTHDITTTIEGHLLGHPRYSATSIFKDWSVRKLRKLVLRSLDNRSGKRCTKGHSLMIMLH